MLCILAFFGITNWEELTGSVPSGGGIADISVGECFDLVTIDDPPVPAPCDESKFEVLGRFPHDESSYEQYWGFSNAVDGFTEGRYEMATCAVALGWNLEEGRDPSLQALSIYTDNGREVLCHKMG